MENKEPELNQQQDESDTLEGEDSNRILFTRKFEPPHEQSKKEKFLKNLIKRVASPEIASEDLSDKLYLFTKNIFIKSIKANLKKISNKKPKNEPESLGLTLEERKLSFLEIAGIKPKKEIKYIRAYKKMKIDNKNVIISIIAEKLNDKYFLKLLKHLIWENEYENIREEDIEKKSDKLNEIISFLISLTKRVIKFNKRFKNPLIPHIEYLYKKEIKKSQLYSFLKSILKVSDILIEGYHHVLISFAYNYAMKNEININQIIHNLTENFDDKDSLILLKRLIWENLNYENIRKDIEKISEEIDKKISLLAEINYKNHEYHESSLIEGEDERMIEEHEFKGYPEDMEHPDE